jgi:hypothetical protein
MPRGQRDGSLRPYCLLRPLIGLLYELLMMMIVEQSVECLLGETEVLGERERACPSAPVSTTNLT